MKDKIYRVNMTELTTSIEEVPQDWVGMGGPRPYLDHRGG